MNESNFRDELEEVWVPKDAGELEGLLLTIQNEPGKKILKHKIQQTIKVYRDLNQDLWNVGYHEDWDQAGIHIDYSRELG
jgi:ABC-type cobalt transport system substrate-binding protein